jgi:hypothetical protein
MRRLLIVVLAAGSTAARLWSFQDQAPKENLVQQLQAAYVPTVMDANWTKVEQRGTVLVIKKDGLSAYTSGGVYANKYDDGILTTDGKTAALRGLGSALNPLGMKTADARPLAAGEKVYVTRTSVLPDKGVMLEIVTCGSCDPAAADPSHRASRASVLFRMNKGWLSSTDFKHVQAVIAEVFDSPQEASAGAVATTDQQPPVQSGGSAPGGAPSPAAEEPRKQFAPIAPPPPPPAAPVTIEIGQTFEQVTAALGQPESTAKLSNNKQISVFKDYKITFVNGKVSNVDLR